MPMFYASEGRKKFSASINNFIDLFYMFCTINYIGIHIKL